MCYKDPNQNHKMENKIFGAKTFILCSLKSHNTPKKKGDFKNIHWNKPLNTKKKNWINVHIK